jgi:two-component system cell cycle response regulator
LTRVGEKGILMDSGFRAASGNDTLIRESATLKLKLEEAKKSKPCLVIALGKPLGKRFVLGSKPQSIGRGAECEIPIMDASLSRTHAQILRNKAGRYYVRDLDSTNGTFLNDQKLAPGEASALKDGDFIKVGNIVFKFVARGKIDNVFHKDMLNLAMRDDLTGIPNRKSIKAILEEQFHKARMANQPLSLIVLDLDDFKSVNDTFGHAAGDVVLAEAVKIVQSAIRNKDYVGRFGGDEFLAVLWNTSLANACVIAERIRSKLERHRFAYESKAISVTASLGIAFLDESVESVDALFKMADEAHYKAKKNGGNQVFTN